MKKQKAPKKLSTELRDKTLTLLHNRPQHLFLAKIDSDTGLPETWLRAFGQNRVKEPSVNRVETLYNYLSKQKLKVS